MSIRAGWSGATGMGQKVQNQSTAGRRGVNTTLTFSLKYLVLTLHMTLLMFVSMYGYYICNKQAKLILTFCFTDIPITQFGTQVYKSFSNHIFKILKPPLRQPSVCCCVVVAAAYTNRGSRPGLPAWGFNWDKNNNVNLLMNFKQHHAAFIRLMPHYDSKWIRL